MKPPLQAFRVIFGFVVGHAPDRRPGSHDKGINEGTEGAALFYGNFRLAGLRVEDFIQGMEKRFAISITLFSKITERIKQWRYRSSWHM